MKSQASQFYFGCLFHRMPFYHRTKQPSLWEEVKRDCQIKTQLPAEPHPHSILRVEDPRRTWTLQKLADTTPPPNLMCSVEGAWLKKQQITNETEFPKKQHLLPASYASAAAQLGPREPWAPYAPILAGCCSASPLHIHRITSCAKQAVYVERMPS